MTSKGDVHDLEIDHVAVERVSQEVKTRGILMHPLPGQLISGIHIHHNFVTNTLAEGIYMGSEPHDQPFDSLAKLERVEIDHNLVMDVGFDGIKIKVAIADVAVHHNVIRNAGISRTPAHQGGIKVAMSVGDFYNNTVIGAVEGIRANRELESPRDAVLQQPGDRRDRCRHRGERGRRPDLQQHGRAQQRSRHSRQGR